MDGSSTLLGELASSAARNLSRFHDTTDPNWRCAGVVALADIRAIRKLAAQADDALVHALSRRISDTWLAELLELPEDEVIRQLDWKRRL